MVFLPLGARCPYPSVLLLHLLVPNPKSKIQNWFTSSLGSGARGAQAKVSDLLPSPSTRGKVRIGVLALLKGTPSFILRRRGGEKCKGLARLIPTSRHASPTASACIKSATLSSFSRSWTNAMILVCCAAVIALRVQPRNFSSTSAGDMRFFGWPFG